MAECATKGHAAKSAITHAAKTSVSLFLRKSIFVSTIASTILASSVISIGGSKQPSIEPIVLSNADIAKMKRGERLLTLEEECRRRVEGRFYSGREEELSKEIKETQRKISKMKLQAKFGYNFALKQWKHFDYEKARSIALDLVERGKLHERSVEIFISACKLWPLIKVYSEKLPFYDVDPKISILVAFAESRLDEKCMTKNREGRYDVGAFQLNERWGPYYQKLYSRHNYWIEGRDFRYTPNNILLGVHIVRDRLRSINCTNKCLGELDPMELFMFYNSYTGSSTEFRGTAERHVNIVSCLRYIRMLPLVEKAVQENRLTMFVAEKERKNNSSKPEIMCVRAK